MEMNWTNTKELRKAAEQVFNDLTNGTIDTDTAKALGAQIRTVSKLVCTEIEMMKLKGVDMKTIKEIASCKLEQ